MTADCDHCERRILTVKNDALIAQPANAIKKPQVLYILPDSVLFNQFIFLFKYIRLAWIEFTTQPPDDIITD